MLTCHKKIKWITPFFYIFFFLPTLVEGKNLEVPFTSQAPDANWSQPWLDACEETSVAMVQAYYQNKIFSITTAKASILEIFRIKNPIYGESLDENAATVTELVNNYLPWETEMKENPTLEEIKEQIDLGYPVIIPVDGKILRNPHFRNGGPVYHMLVISGYDDDKQEFITQEPGTRFGKNYPYSYTTIEAAIHDYLPNAQTKNGRRVVIFTRPVIFTSAATDADRDGLPKSEELTHGTSLVSGDTDNDGFGDKQEILNGYSPLVNEHILVKQSLLKEMGRPQVYLVQDGTKHHITSESAFLNRGLKWNDIITVSQKFLESLPEGENLN